MLLVIDNYDSFTFNLVQYLGELAPHHPIAADLQVHRNDALTLAQIRELKPNAKQIENHNKTFAKLVKKARN